MDVNSRGFAPLNRHALRFSKPFARVTGAKLKSFAPVLWDPPMLFGTEFALYERNGG